MTDRARCRKYEQSEKGRARNRRRARLYNAKNKAKRAARRRVLLAIEKGLLMRPNACSRCERSCIPQAHHADYSKALEVIWLCRNCHDAEHGADANL